MAIDFAVNPVTTYRKHVTGATTATVTTTLNTVHWQVAPLLDVELNGTTDSVNMSVAGTYIFDARTTVAGDVKSFQLRYRLCDTYPRFAGIGRPSVSPQTSWLLERRSLYHDRR